MAVTYTFAPGVNTDFSSELNQNFTDAEQSGGLHIDVSDTDATVYTSSSELGPNGGQTGTAVATYTFTPTNGADDVLVGVKLQADIRHDSDAGDTANMRVGLSIDRNGTSDEFFSEVVSQSGTTSTTHYILLGAPSFATNAADGDDCFTTTVGGAAFGGFAQATYTIKLWLGHGTGDADNAEAKNVIVTCYWMKKQVKTTSSGKITGGGL